MSGNVKEIVEQEFEVQGNPSLRKFAEWMMEGMSKEGETLSHASIINWLAGKPPKTEFLEDMLAVYPVTDRRFALALRLLAAKSPHVWGVEGVVWRLHKSLQKSK
jgi:hypothetical protein